MVDCDSTVVSAGVVGDGEGGVVSVVGEVVGNVDV